MKKNDFGWALLICAMLIPCVFMLFFYQNGQNAIYVDFGLLIKVTLALAAAAGIVWLIARAVLHSPLSAYLISLCASLALFLGDRIAENLPFTHFKTAAVYAFFIAAGIAAALIVRKKKETAKIAAVFVAVITAVMLLFNIIPTVRLYMAIYHSGAAADTEEYIKTDFAQTVADDTPNIYWIHCDGMLGFDTIERYSGDAQTEAYDTLTELGFYVNRSAWLEATHSTTVAVPSLMCPAFYDEYLAEFLEGGDEGVTYLTENKASYMSLLTEAVENNELTASLFSKDYNISIVAEGTFYYYFPDSYYVSRVYNDYGLFTREVQLQTVFDDIFDQTQIVDFCGAISQPLAAAVDRLTAVDIETVEMTGEKLTDEELADILETENISARENYCRNFDYVYDVMTSSDEPYFVLYVFPYDHQPFVADENGDALTENTGNTTENYYRTHAYNMRVLVNLVSMIRENDPAAVIVLQADHGTHMLSAEQLTAETGSADAAADFWNQVMSAVYVPEKYRSDGYEEILANPLNISRYLVNTFVGPNYEYR